jgi:hypothetical protein
MGHPELIWIVLVDGNRHGNIERIGPVNMEDELDAAAVW